MAHLNTDRRASREPFMGTMRALAEAYLAFMRTSDRRIRSFGLTTPQFDVIAALGNTQGLSCKEISERTLVTKGTLTGVLDRLEAMDLVERVPSREDRRVTIIRLTAKGRTTFHRVFSQQIDHLRPRFAAALNESELLQLERLLVKFRKGFETGAVQSGG